MRGLELTAILVFLSSLAVGSDWQRVIVLPSASSGRIDSPAPQKMAYFTESPVERDLDEDDCRYCSPDERAKRTEDLWIRIHPEVRRVGMVKGFEIFDIFYPHVPAPTWDSPGDWNGPVWKSILVKVGSDQYREIYHYQGPELDSMSPSVLMGPVLETEYKLGSMKMLAEEYFWFDETGPTRVDQEPIVTAARAVLPADVILYPLWLGGSYAVPSLVFRIPTLSAGLSVCCGPGEAEVKVALVKGKIGITKVRYDPGKQ